MHKILIGALALAMTSPLATAAIAQDTEAAATAVTPEVGQMLRDADGRRIGRIKDIDAENVSVVVDMRMFYIPISSLSMGPNGLQTSLKRTELR